MDRSVKIAVSSVGYVNGATAQAVSPLTRESMRWRVRFPLKLALASDVKWSDEVLIGVFKITVPLLPNLLII